MPPPDRLPRSAPRTGDWDAVSVLGLVAILMLLSAAMTAMLADRQAVGIVTWLALLFVCACFAGSWLALRALLLDRLESRFRSLPTRLIARAALVVAASALGAELAARALAAAGGEPADRARGDFFTVGVAITAALVLVESGYRRLRRRARDHELREERLERQAVSAELAALRARTDPHFLFNSLNVVAALVEEDPVRASGMLERLGALFRHSLEASRRERVPLADEVAAARTYLEIQELRFGERLRWSIEVDEALLARPVPPLLLQPLVENAIVHGIAPRREAGRVAIRVAAEDAGLRLEVDDDGAAAGAGAGVGSGTALADLAERLRLAYGGRASLEHGPRPEGGYRARLRLPAETREGSPP